MGSHTTVKDLLLKQSREAFSANDEMSLLSSVRDLTQTEAEWKLNETTWSIEEILFHVGSCKVEYCRQAFGKWNESVPQPFGDLGAMIRLNQTAQDHLVECLDACSDADLSKPVPAVSHGESAAHLFWILIMHDISHGAQIRTIRRAFGTRTHYYPIR